MSRVLVIGLDGATWDLLMPLAKEGFLPTLAKLMEGGSYGELESTMPPVTAPAWASFATGKNPGKTGVFDFLIPRRSLDDLTPITSKDISGKTFYEILDNNGKRTILVNLPVSYPPRTKNPTITSILTQGDQFIYPASLMEEIPKLAEYRITPDFDLKFQGSDEEYFEDIRKLENVRFACCQKLFEHEWDFFFLLFAGIDWIQHHLYDKLITNSLDKNHVAFQLFHDIDSYVGWFVDHLPSEASLLLMSDHGFRTYRGTFHINQWLKENDFLESHYVRKHTGPYQHLFVEGMAEAQAKSMDRGSAKKIASLILPSFVIDVLQRLGLGRICGVLEKHFPSLQIQIAVNYRRARALCPTFELSGLYLNRAGRFQDGIIEPQDARHIREQIISGLRRLRDPVTGEAAFDGVLGNEVVYSGERARFAPDILILPKDFWVAPAVLSSDNKSNIFKEGILNYHSPSGIFLAYGPGIKKGNRLDGAKIYDIAPTILHILGVPIPKDTDGRVLKEGFEHDSEFARRPVEYVRTDEREQIRRKISELKRLKGL